MSNYKCPNGQTPVEDSNVGTMGDMLLEKLNIPKSCNTASFSLGVAAEANVGLFAQGKAASQLASVNNSGCEAVSVLIGNYLNSVYLSKCIINDTKISSTKDIDIRQSANVSASGGGIVHPPVDCPGGSSINQTVHLSLKDLTRLDTVTQNKIGEVVKQGMANTVDQLLQQKTGFQSTSQGLKDLTAIQSKITTISSDTTIQKAYNEAQETIRSYQSADQSANGAGSQIWQICKINQESIMELQIATIISNAYASTISSELSAFMQTALSKSVEIESAGAPNIFEAVFGGGNWMIIAGVVVALIIGFIAIKFMKSKKGQAALGNLMNKGKMGGLLEKSAKSFAFRHF